MSSDFNINILEESLRQGGIENHHQESRWLADHVRRSHPAASAEQLNELLQPLAERRISGEPLQYILGTVEFYDLELQVGPGVLIPRQETELLVDLALQKYCGHGDILDLCTGSGAVVLNLARHLPDSRLWGADISPLALHWAELNQKRLQIDNVSWLCGDLFMPLPTGKQTFSLITANPPYVSQTEYQTLSPTVKDYEPRSALLAGENGLQITRRIIEEAPEWLEDGGWLLLEIGCTQGEEGLALMHKSGFGEAAALHDYTGRTRFLAGRKKA